MYRSLVNDKYPPEERRALSFYLFLPQKAAINPTSPEAPAAVSAPPPNTASRPGSASGHISSSAPGPNAPADASASSGTASAASLRMNSRSISRTVAEPVPGVPKLYAAGGEHAHHGAQHEAGCNHRQRRQRNTPGSQARAAGSLGATGSAGSAAPPRAEASVLCAKRAQERTTARTNSA